MQIRWDIHVKKCLEQCLALSLCSKNISHYHHCFTDLLTLGRDSSVSSSGVLPVSVPGFSSPTHSQLKDVATLSIKWGKFKVLTAQNCDKSQILVMHWAWYILKALNGPYKGPSGFPSSACSVWPQPLELKI